MMTANYSIDLMTINEIDLLFDFRKRVLPDNSKQADRKRWLWLLRDNPCNNGELTTWVLRTNGNIVGSSSCIPCEFICSGAQLTAGFGVDYFVDEGFKGLPALKLLKTSQAFAGVHVVTNLSDSARNLFPKLGYVDLSSFLNHAVTYLKPLPGKKDRLRSKLKRTYYRRVRRKYRAAPDSLLVDDQLPPAYADLWERVKSTCRIGVNKNLAYMKWRYEQCPTVKYRFVSLVHGALIEGLAVVTINEEQGLRRGVIHDLILPADSQVPARKLLAATLDHFCDQGCQLCETHLMAPGIAGSLEKSGFSLTQSQLGMMVHFDKRNADLAEIVDGNAWTFSLGDTDRY